MREAASLTPMFRQYQAHKQRHPEAILLFRMGDFYEMFYEDAEHASRVLELTLTARGRGTDHVVPMCGFPHHQLDAYTARLVQADLRVAICDQVEDPRRAKGLVRREVVRVITPGTINDPAVLDAKADVWLASLADSAGRPGAAFLEASTGEFLAWEPTSDEPAPFDALAERLRAFSPREIVYPDDLAWLDTVRSGLMGGVWTATETHAFAPDVASDILCRQFRVASLDGFGFRERPAAIAAAGGLFRWLQETQQSTLAHIDHLQLHEPAGQLLLDAATRRNLELERSIRDGGRRGSLVEAIDATLTPAGGRLLRRRILAPLLDPAAIGRRLDTVEELVANNGLRRRLRDELEGVRDIERLLARLVGGQAGPRELLALRASLERVPLLVTAAENLRAPLLREAVDRLDPCTDVADHIHRALVDEPPAALRDGGAIRDGFHAELDELRLLRREGRNWLTSLELQEREATGIASLKVRYNKIFGYYIEISRPNLSRVPGHYERKQTVAGGERFVTAALRDYESRILRAEERIESLELELFAKLRDEIASHAARLKAVARVTAEIDLFSAWAELAVRQDLCRPEVNGSGILRIRGGRHPVVERHLAVGRFVPNDTELDIDARAIAVLTGPNMGGKSTYLRQVALIVLLGQAGSFVPAESASLGVVDRIFCRVGASDSLSEGQSTFMVEMSETANILRNATPRSLVVLDEIGRGTATFDGLSLAWAIVEYLHALPGGAPRTLFATHYHELTELAVQLDGVLNLRMAVRERGESVAFLHRVEPGPADRSYGIHVARLAGVPREVVARAEEILANLERDEYGRDGLPRRAKRRGAPSPPLQPTLFDALTIDDGDRSLDSAMAARVLAELRDCDPDSLRPIDALQQLAEWRRRLRGDGSAS